MYEIILSDNAIKQLKKLEKSVQQRITAVLERSRIRPEIHFQKLVGKSSYRLRVGDYRIIADLNKKQLQILVIQLGHRKNIYEKL
jgi:mRNA interferase RelE/StbE